MRPLEGRRIWLVGIGGAGLSGYALLARAWGAEVGGWDRNETPYLRSVRAAGIEVRVSPEPELPDGWEIVVSSAYPEVDGRPRAELLAELVAAAPSIVVAGAHGKTTTAAMIAYGLRETGRDPSWIVGGEVPQLGSNAGAGERLAGRGRRRVRPVGRRRCAPASQSSSTSTSTTTRSSARVPRSRSSSSNGCRTCPRSCSGGSSTHSTTSSRCRASTIAGMPRLPRPHSSSSGCRGKRLSPRSRRSGVSAADSSSSGRRAGWRSSTTTRTTRRSCVRRLRPRGRGRGPRARARALSAAPVLAHAAPREGARS